MHSITADLSTPIQSLDIYIISFSVNEVNQFSSVLFNMFGTRDIPKDRQITHNETAITSRKSVACVMFLRQDELVLMKLSLNARFDKYKGELRYIWLTMNGLL